MVLKCSLQLDSTHWLVVINRNYYNGLSPRHRHCCELKVIWQFHKNHRMWELCPGPYDRWGRPQRGSDLPKVTKHEWWQRWSQTLRTCELFLGMSMYSWVSYALCPGLPFLLVKSFDLVAKWPGFGLCVREVVISRTWLTPLLWEAFSEPQIMYSPTSELQEHSELWIALLKFSWLVVPWGQGLVLFILYPWFSP